MKSKYAYVWEFEVPPAADAEFRLRYGPNGSWVALFHQDPAHVETLLLEDQSNPGRYLTIDRWENSQAFQSFRERFAKQYEALDHLCERLTSRETFLGSFSVVSGEKAA
jgi:hypothetical protein